MDRSLSELLDAAVQPSDPDPAFVEDLLLRLEDEVERCSVSDLPSYTDVGPTDVAVARGPARHRWLLAAAAMVLLVAAVAVGLVVRSSDGGSTEVVASISEACEEVQTILDLRTLGGVGAVSMLGTTWPADLEEIAAATDELISVLRANVESTAVDAEVVDRLGERLAASQALLADGHHGLEVGTLPRLARDTVEAASAIDGVRCEPAG